MKFLKAGKVVIVTQGRYAGRKAVLVKVNEDAKGKRPYGNALVAGVRRYPLKVTKGMSKKRLSQRSRVTPFLKVLNLNHVMPTRYNLDVDGKKEKISEILKPFEAAVDPAKRRAVRGQVKKFFQERYLSGKNKWFFSKLRF